MDVKTSVRALAAEEKAALVMGADFWSTAAVDRIGLRAVRMADGPHGLRKQPIDGEENAGINDSLEATCFPPAALASSSFDRELYALMGRAIAEEAVVQGVDVVLGPAVNIKRSPLCGRNFEYVSEDPYVAAEYATAFVEGLQGAGVGASLKHFAVNNQETLRMNVDAVVDERALRELYLYAFERTVRRARPWTVMASYNRVNGEQACESARLLTGVLRGEWGYDGLVVSDWGAIADRGKALLAGCDLEMPRSGPSRTARLARAAASNPELATALDESAGRVAALAARVGGAARPAADPATVYARNHGLARRIASESMVLLKNDGGALPLRRGARLALAGAFARSPRFQGGGSSHIRPARLSSILDRFREEGLDYVYSPGYSTDSREPDGRLIAEAAEAARGRDAAVVVIGLTDLDEYEGLDRRDLSLPPAHLALLDAVSAACPNTVVVLCAGSAVDMGWEAKARAVLYAGVTGQAGGEAAFDILFGAVNPSGRLTETFPLSLSDTPCHGNFPGGTNSVRYAESVYVGYRYYASAGAPVRYPFGYGLSYTSFSFSGLSARAQGLSAQGRGAEAGASPAQDSGVESDGVESDGSRGHGAEAPLLREGETLSVGVDARNDGTTDGAAVVQLYVRSRCALDFTPSVQLKGFAKVFLRAGETRRVLIDLPYDAFSRYDTRDGWVVDPGEYEVFAARDSSDLGLSLRVAVEGRGRAVPGAGIETYARPTLGCFAGERGLADFERLYGRPLPPLDSNYSPITLDTPLRFCRRTITGRLLRLAVDVALRFMNRGPGARAARTALMAAADDSPLRNITSMNALTTLETGEALVDMMNGRFWRGLARLRSTLRRKAPSIHTTIRWRKR